MMADIANAAGGAYWSNHYGNYISATSSAEVLGRTSPGWHGFAVLSHPPLYVGGGMMFYPGKRVHSAVCISGFGRCEKGQNTYGSAARSIPPMNRATSD